MDNPLYTFLQPLLIQFAGLAGVAALVAALVNVAKTAGWVPDGKAPNAVLALNAVGFVLLMLAKQFIPAFNIEYTDATAGQIANSILNLVQLASQLGLTKVFHTGFKGLPVLGTSYSLKQ